MLLEHRLRRLEAHLKSTDDRARDERLRAQFRLLMQNEPASCAMDAITEASSEWGRDDPRTKAVMERHTPVLAAALQRRTAMP
jgi:hypothetical protein